MKAMAVFKRSSPMRTRRVHFVRADGTAFCRLKPRGGWREIANRQVDCPRCQHVMARARAQLPNA